MARHFISFLMAIALLCGLLACGGESGEGPEVTAQSKADSGNATSSALPTFTNQALQRQTRLQQQAFSLSDAVRRFIEQPQAETLGAAQAVLIDTYVAWYEARWAHQWLIDSAQVGHATMTRIDPFPIMPGYIDAVAGYPESGLVFAPEMPLTPDNLLAQHQLTSDEEACLGFAVIHFLLFGEHNDRKASDYLAVSAWPEKTESLTIADHPNNRRRQLLTLTTQQLLNDIRILGDALTSPGYREPTLNDTLVALWAMLFATENLLPGFEEFFPAKTAAKLRVAQQPDDTVVQAINAALQAQYGLPAQTLAVNPGWPDNISDIRATIPDLDTLVPRRGTTGEQNTH